MADDRVVLRPDRVRAAWWGAVGVTATALAAWSFSASRASLALAVLLTLCAVPTAAFLLQLLAPDTWTLTVDRDGVHGHVAAFRVDEPFADLRHVDLDRVVGEPVLVLVGQRRRRLLLPVGCRLDRLRAVLQEVGPGG